MSRTWMSRRCLLVLLGAALLTALAAAGLFPGAPSGEAAAEEKKGADKVKPLRALLVIGGCCHDYAKQKEILAKCLAARAQVEVVIAYDPDTSTRHLNPVYEKPDWSKGFDVVIHDECSSDVKDLDVINRILEPHRQGLPAVLLHCCMHSYRSEGYPKSTAWFDFTGVASTAHGPQLPIAITFTDKPEPFPGTVEIEYNPGRDLATFHIDDKLLFVLSSDPEASRPSASSASALTHSVWPCRRAVPAPLTTSHSRTVPSSEPAARRPSASADSA